MLWYVEEEKGRRWGAWWQGVGIRTRWSSLWKECSSRDLSTGWESTASRVTRGSSSSGMCKGPEAQKGSDQVCVRRGHVMCARVLISTYTSVRGFHGKAGISAPIFLTVTSHLSYQPVIICIRSSVTLKGHMKFLGNLPQDVNRSAAL